MTEDVRQTAARQESAEMSGSWAQKKRSDRISGTLLMAGSAASFSTIGLFTRLNSLPLPDVLFIRGVFGALAIWVVARLFTRQRITDKANLHWPALSLAALFTIGMTSLVIAYRIGTVINVSVIYATIPIIVGLIQMTLLRQRRPSSLLGAALLQGGVGCLRSGVSC
jgi:drug/metabolite transporter (DMT)-like permease